MDHTMRLHIRAGALFGPLALAAVLLVLAAQVAAGSQPSSFSGDQSDGMGLPYWQSSGDVNSPDISAIDSPSASCVRPVASAGDCYVRWYYMNVTASSSQYIISMTVTIDGRLRAYHSGFFQSSMFIPGTMMGKGFQVACGLPGSGGKPGLGETYNYAIRARETGGLTAANYGFVTCPAANATFLPFVKVNRLPHP